MKALVTAALFTISLVSANAAMSMMSITEFTANKADNQKWGATVIYLNGVGVGATLSAATLIKQNKPTLFCQPEEIVLGQKDYIKLINVFISKNELPDETPVETALMMALVTAFPCK
jgi:hypothetical protein